MNFNSYGYGSYNHQMQGVYPYGTAPMPNSLQISYTNGLVGAKGYSVPPNTTIFLMDSDAPQFFIKTSDRNGMCTIKTYRFEEVAANGEPLNNQLDTSMFVTKQELDEKLAKLIAAKNEPSKPSLL